MKPSIDGETIAAIGTPIGQAGIGIVRMSGSGAMRIAEKVFRPKKPVRNFKSHHLYLGHFVDPSSGCVIDEVLLSRQKAPNSYTREDVVEINSHSGYLLHSKILQILLQEGVRLAEPGEFTYRAFMNGRIDLTQAEATVDLIQAISEKGLQLASRQIGGKFRATIEQLKHTALEILAQVEVAIDFPEEESGILPPEQTAGRLEREIVEPIEQIISTHSQRKIWMEGIVTVIAGRVNVGKSSLLNRLLNEERAIVTPIPGTTRDVIESTIHIEGVPFRLMDTAGFRKVKGSVERLGIRLSEQKLAEADISLIVIDRSLPLDEEDLKIIDKTQQNARLIILNKVDLPSRLEEERMMEVVEGSTVVKISAMTGDGIEALRRTILDLALMGNGGRDSSNVIPNLRHKNALLEASRFFRTAGSGTLDGRPPEIVAQDMQSGLNALGEIIGETTNEEVLDEIFSRFCLGK